ncbi:Bicarbonate transport system permease protein CmpB [Candidatus Brocadiaceae bacterium B188]|nr:ABC transporter permease subunit [Candidatus Brocadia sapporoensis]QQR67597.1 MAG: ABC transporter permease subunit [Candidatus Brocadia sp.]RZV59001.1 MAG: ABC transporter permease subunit [Candidatus Brocadia sp. BROELEC01]TWU52430.1 Bicarbonate transport system permease protein CmpB [Candidatus Brocadiaceae bacterium B188]
MTKIFHNTRDNKSTHKPVRFGWIDFFLILGITGLFCGFISVKKEWMGTLCPTVEIDLSPWALPKYTFFSMMRGIIAYGFSLIFTLVYGYWAAKDRIAEKVLIPLLDILQSIPVLGFMPGLVLTFVSLFHQSNIGLELAAIIMIFTGQVWNMTFSFYHSLRAVPADMRQAATSFQFDWWQTLKWIEIPCAIIGLIWNSMMSMAGGWFYLMICEAFVLGQNDFRLPGVGSYMSVAVNHNNLPAMIYAITAMMVMIVFLDFFLWRPAIAWSQKFKIEETGTQTFVSSFFLNWLKKAGLLHYIGSMFSFIIDSGLNYLSSLFSGKKAHLEDTKGIRPPFHVFMWIIYAAFISLFGFGCWKLYHLLQALSLSNWHQILWCGCLTLFRVLSAVIIGTLWTFPVGLIIGLSPKLSRILQPGVQIVASFPAPMLYTIIVILLQIAGISLNFGSIVLMLLGTQWYILFNVIAGTMSIPTDLKEVSYLYEMNLWQRLKNLYIPAVFPFLITGWVAAAGGAWNASIVAEFFTLRGRIITANGLGAIISQAAEKADFALLAGAVLTMSVFVVVFNRIVWRSLYNIVQKKYTFS